MIIDAHASIGPGLHLSAEVAELLLSMDEASVDKAIICSTDKFLAVENRRGNELVLQAVRDYPDRLVGLASANPWFGDDAVVELKRAFDAGARGLYLHPGYQGFRLNDPIVFPLLEVALDYQVVVYAHTGLAGSAEPYHVALLAERYRGLNFIMGHAGSSDYGEDAVVALDMVPNLWLESSRNGPANFNFWRLKEKQARVVFGSSFPEYFHTTEIESLSEIIRTDLERNAIFSETIRVVFGGDL